MASSLKFVCLFFLLTTLVFSLQAHARDSQFFSKVSRNRDEAPTTTTNTNKFFMNNKETEFEPLNKQQEQEKQPTFIPQTTETGYGLYGHETGLDPPATTSTTTSLYNMDENNYDKNNFEDFNSYFNNINDHEDHHEKNYAPELKGLSRTSYSTNVAPTKYLNNFNKNNNNYNNDDKQQGKYYYNNNNNDDDEKNGKYYYNGGAKYNDVQEKQGMSDTRFLENGKYYYDVNGEKTYEPNTNYMSHTNNYNNNFETNGYYGNNKANRFDAYYDAYYRNNNNNNFFSGNRMQGYQNQVPQEDEFAFDDQP